MDFIGPVFEILKCLWGPASRKIGYMKDLKGNFEKLSKEVQKLHDMKEDMNREIKNAGKRPTSQCKGWLDEAEKMEQQWKEMENEYKENKKCMGRCCPHVSSRMNLGKRILDLTVEVVNHQEKSEFKGGMVVDEPSTITEMSAPKLEAETSTDRTLKEILAYIDDERVKVIGIWGMGGVGKTTVMKVLNNRPEIAQTFDVVIWVTVSKEWSYRYLQHEVAERLQVRREDGESDASFAQKLFRKLKAKKFLLLLDDVWDGVDLEKVGVPISSDEDTSSKVVLSTRQRRVCNQMKTDKDVKVDVLSDYEAWVLFRKQVGEVVDSPSIKPLAEGVVKECCGLPLAIVVVGKALRNEDDIHVWRTALNQLSSSGAIEIEDMEEQVFNRVKFSYDRLKNENSKNCFLYCAMYPEDYEIRKIELIEYWRSEGIIGSWVTLTEACDKGYSVLKELMDASLLEKCRSDDCVKMHDVIRDLALRIMFAEGQGGYRYLVRAGMRLSEDPSLEEWEQARRISLMETNITDLPEEPNCQMLSTLLLRENYTWRRFSPSFFKHMSALRVLDLSGTAIELLPPSLCNLVNLKGLYLDRCGALKALPPQVGALTKLEVFHMNGESQVESLPAEMGELVSLRRLQVKLCIQKIYSWRGTEEERQARQEIKMITGGTFSKLSQLEQLSIYVDQWNFDLWVECAAPVVTEELCRMKRLTHLDLRFPEAEDLDHFIEESPSWNQGSLKSFRFVIGYHDRQIYETWRFEWEDYDHKLFEHWKGILICKGGDGVPRSIEVILKHTDALLMEGPGGVGKLMEFGLENINMLKECALIECQGMETIVNGDGLEDDSIVFPSLESLHLWNLFNLTSIWQGHVPSGTPCFTVLKELEVHNCSKLTKMLPWVIIQQLSNLERLIFHHCPAIEAIITSEGGGKETCSVIECDNIMPRLKTLDLAGMLGLVHIYSEELSLPAWPLLKEISVVECPVLKTLPRCIVNAPNLGKIKCQREWWAALEWEDDAIKRRLQSILKFKD